MSKNSKILLVMCLLRPAQPPAEKLHRTDTSHLWLCVLFLVLLPKHLLSRLISSSSLDHPNCTAALPLFVVELLIIVERSLTCLSFSSSFVAPRSSFGLLSPSTHLNDDRIFQSRCNTLGSLVLLLLCSLFLLCSFQRHQLFLDLVNSDRRRITPCVLFLLLGVVLHQYHRGGILFRLSLRLFHLSSEQSPSAQSPLRAVYQPPWRQVCRVALCRPNKLLLKGSPAQGCTLLPSSSSQWEEL